MRRLHSLRLSFKLAALALLISAFAVLLQTSLPSARAVAGCSTCDTTYQACWGPVLHDYEECVNSGNHTEEYCAGVRDFGLTHCRQMYEMCLSSCEPDGGGTGGGGGGGCGRGRTACELSCTDAKHDCVSNGGDTCGEEYNACMAGCCP
jgi:hypothetical protein